MTEKKLEIRYKEYTKLEDLNIDDQNLIKTAFQAQKTSYAPYSKFNVGAAVLLDNGMIVKGSNQENAAFPSSLCAERTALFAAGATYPDSKVVAIAICGGSNYKVSAEPITPCGACRQVMAEYQRIAGKKVRVFMAGNEKIWELESVNDVLPFIFDSLD